MKRIKIFMLITMLLAIIYSCSKNDPLVNNDNLIIIPSSFSPGDTINQTWFITDLDNLIDSTKFVVRVFSDSSHVKVFESTKKNFIWDGTYNGVPQPTGQYLYYFDYTTWNDLEHIRSGTVWLNRKP